MSSIESIRKTHEPSPRLTLCLAMDLKGSTTAGLQLSSKKLDRFNLALVTQLDPHLVAVGLDSTVIKFTGDGWLVMSDDQEHAAPLCCLAIIMACRFQPEMSIQTGLPTDRVPAIRLAICWGRDLEVVLHTGQREFVGNSVRRAVRALQLCRDNEVIVDETVRTWIQQDFLTSRIDMDKRISEQEFVKMEEELVLHTLEEMKPESADDPEAPVYFVNTLSIIGRGSEAVELASRISDHLQHEAIEQSANQTELLWRWNRLLASNVDYETARGILSDLRAAGLHPDVETLNALIDKAQDYRTESKWLQAMIQEGVKPNVFTFNTLLDKARDHARIEKWLSRMNHEGIEPNIVTLNTLLAKAKDYAASKTWLDRMRKRGIEPTAASYDMLIEKADSFKTAKVWLEKMLASGSEPSENTFIALFSKDLSEVQASELLKWYLGLPIHPTKPIQRAIASYRRKGLIGEALRLALDYPHTQTALKLVREYPDQALAYFREVVDENPEHANGAYALGRSLIELGREREGKPWLRKALKLAGAGPRRDELVRLLAPSDLEEIH